MTITTESNRNVGFGDSISLFFKNYVNFNGRSSRGAYWWLFLFSLIISVPLNVLSATSTEDSVLMIVGLVSFAWGLATILPSISLAVRRLHDSGKSGWWLLIGLTGIGLLVLIVFYLLPGTRGENKYGPDVEAGR
jgi:uncharacterized membrane protein YhaH (DUF805 family)